MTDRQLPFSAPMIIALLAGRKTQRRLVLKPQPWLSMAKKWNWEPSGKKPFCTWGDGPPYIPITDALAMDQVPCAVGDRIWVRETLKRDMMNNILTVERDTKAAVAYYAADDAECLTPDEFNLAWIWKGSSLSVRFMPRAFSRLTLEVTGVKVERVQDISEEDAIKEGALEGIKIAYDDAKPWARLAFSELWNLTYGPGAWEANPWVFALTFIVHKCNIDALRRVP